MDSTEYIHDSVCNRSQSAVIVLPRAHSHLFHAGKLAQSFPGLNPLDKILPLVGGKRVDQINGSLIDGKNIVIGQSISVDGGYTII